MGILRIIKYIYRERESDHRIKREIKNIDKTQTWKRKLPLRMTRD